MQITFMNIYFWWKNNKRATDQVNSKYTLPPYFVKNNKYISFYVEMKTLKKIHQVFEPMLQ